MQTATLHVNASLPPVGDEDNAYRLLDDPAEWSAFSQPAEGLWDSRLVIEGMTCAACALNVEKALCNLPGVQSAQVNATSGRARIIWSADKTRPSQLLQAVRTAGYQALPAADAFMQDQRRKQQRLLLWRWLVAGFCMMQVMMYAWPAYVANPGEMTSDMLNLLRWASWILSLPVLLFSCAPFFRNALNDLKRRRISMDLPVALGILITFVVSTVATYEPNGWWGHEVYFDSLTMFVFFLLTGRWLELRLRDRTAGALESLMNRLPQSIERQKADGSFERVAVRRIVPGDIVRVLPGETFPADGEIMSGHTSADEALLTGESRPMDKPLHAKVIAGSHNLQAPVQVRVSQTGSDTQYAQIVALMERVSVDKPRLAQIADRIAKPFLWAVLLAAGAAAISLWQADPGRAMMAAVAVLIVTCPCALSLATPAAMLTTAGTLARQGVLVRQLQAIEALTKVDTVVFDKTGTLTEDRMKLGKVYTAENLNRIEALQIAASIANHSLHPVSRALAACCEKDSMIDVWNVEEISGFGLMADSSLGRLKLGSAKFCGMDHHSTDTSRVHLIGPDGWLASFVIEEQVKPGAASAIRDLAMLGLQAEVLSGDHQYAVAEVASHVGISEFQANATPYSKLTHIQHLQEQGRKVLMVGDGLNDGPVLAAANVSIAMGHAVPLAQAQSDFVILGGQLALLPVVITTAHDTMHIVRQNLWWAASYNIICIPLAVMGWIPAWLAGLGMAGSSLLVILNAARLSRSFVTKLQAKKS